MWIGECPDWVKNKPNPSLFDCIWLYNINYTVQLINDCVVYEKESLTK